LFRLKLLNYWPNFDLGNFPADVLGNCSRTLPARALYRAAIASRALVGKIQISQQPLFAGQDMYTGQEALQPLEVDDAFCCN
jgi:hypothetical protein